MTHDGYGRMRSSYNHTASTEACHAAGVELARKMEGWRPLTRENHLTPELLKLVRWIFSVDAFQDLSPDAQIGGTIAAVTEAAVESENAGPAEVGPGDRALLEPLRDALAWARALTD